MYPLSSAILQQFDDIEGTLDVSGNRMAPSLVAMRVITYNKSGKSIELYSQNQRNITGLANQARRFLSRARKFHSFKVELSV